MSKDTVAAIQQIKQAAEGLTFQSETDSPVELFVLEGTAHEPVSAAAILKATQHEPNAPVKTPPLGRFFGPATKEQDWHNDAERQTVVRFKELVTTLKENLTDIKVFKVGQIESEVYVVGKAPSGDLAGVKTKVVET
jgi:hypothetical protein